MLTDPWIAALVALFAWWFSTGAILCLVRLADHRGPGAARVAVILCLPFLALGVWGAVAETGLSGAVAPYVGFGSALLIWGWIELAFLTGIITGPNVHRCPDRVPEWERFLRAWGTIAYHEMLLAGTLAALWLLTRSEGLSFAFWTFAVLFFARISAKLNLFLGVRKVNTEFLPSALAHLPSHFRIAAMNWLFPMSITALSFAVACWLERLAGAANPAEVAGFALLAAITALALLEHWFMVLPLPDEKLWRWMLPAPKEITQKNARPEDAHGL